jgi:hypothetical protein
VQGIPSGQAEASSFGPLSPISTPQRSETNPYQAPIDLGSQIPTAPLPGGAQPIRPTIIRLPEPIEAAWQICKENFSLLLMCLVAMLIGGGINYVGQLLAQVVISVLASLQPPATLVFVIGIALGIGIFVFQTWVQIGQTLFLLKTARGQEASLSILFAGAPYLTSTLLATLALIVAIACIGGVSALLGLGVYAATKEPLAGFIIGLPIAVIGGVYLTLTYGAATFLIADQGLGPLEALQTSSQITSGNRLTLFAIALIALLAGAGSLLLCCVPYLFMVPFIMLTATIAYLKMAGQVTAEQLLLHPSTGTPFASPSSGLR